MDGLRGLPTFLVTLAALIVGVLALGRDYYEITYEPDGGGFHADIGKDNTKEGTGQSPPPRDTRRQTVRTHAPKVARTPAPRETATVAPEISTVPAETSPPPELSPHPEPGATTPPDWEPGGDTGGETTAPAP
ncbi:hypothetical protein Ade02nite_36920 [Paractinoplanes deccanensis]|uniref:Secreted protein n=1 Tax=Paractinoplanes deccanensis TaxID=113561 RepID=A0ABQ3Y4Y9_9ACTN|nr:hypothetical protein Ade02nite_36920 [Actinoplanes deccanensis]